MDALEMGSRQRELKLDAVIEESNRTTGGAEDSEKSILLSCGFFLILGLIFLTRLV